MSSSAIYTLVAIVVLLAVVVIAFILGRREPHNRLSPMAGMAFGFIIAGILFGDNRLVGYTMLGIGIILAVADIIRRPR